MNKRILATLCVTIFVLATLATVQSVSAHYTLGEQNPGDIGEANAGGLPISPTNGGGNGFNRFHVPADWQGHVPGHIAFVQPGTLYIPPSDQNNYYSPDGAVLTDSVGDLFMYICLSDMVGDGQDGPINISWRGGIDPYDTTADSFLTRGPFTLFEQSKFLYIAIPPEFTPPVDWAAGWGDVQTTNQGFGDTSNIETTITNDHNFIQTGKFGPRHPVAPNWWFVRFTAAPTSHPASIDATELGYLTNLDPLFNAKYTTDAVYQGSAGFLYPPHMDPWLDRQMRTGDFEGCYRIKILNMKAPSCAGKYFWKIFYTSTFQPFASMAIQPWQQPPDATAAVSPIYDSIGGWPDLWQVYGTPYPLGTGSTYNHDAYSGYLNGYFEKYDTFYPENYPVILVKGEIDPSYISGTVRYCGHSQYYFGSYYGAGVHTSGKVIAEGTAIDPITFQPTGRPVCGVGWFLGQLPGQGVDWKDRETGTEGFYEVEGLAPGIYTLTAYAAGFVPRTLATQITVKRGQSLHGVDIYVCPTAKLQTKVYSKCPTGPVDWPEYVTMDGFPASMQILPVVPGGASVRGDGPVGPDGVWYWATEGATTVQAKNIWADLTTLNAPGPWNPDADAATLGTLMNAYDVTADMEAIAGRYGWAWQELVDSNGTAVAWQDYTFDRYQDVRSFGTFWGDPSCYSGVETMWDGHVPTFLADFTSGVLPGQYRVKTWVFGYVQTKEYVVDFPAVEFPGTAYMEMDLFKGGVINATVHFHDQELPSAETSPNSPCGFLAHLVMEAYDANGVLQAWNSTDDFCWQSEDNSFGTSLLLIGQSNACCEMGRVHGMPEGTYTIKAYLKDYCQQEFPMTTVQYCTNGSLSFHLMRGAGITVTVYSRDCQDPSQPVNWAHPGETIMLDLCSEAADIFAPDFGIRNWAYQVPGTSSAVVCTAGGTGGLIDYLDYCGGFKPSCLPTGQYRVVARTPGYVQLAFPEVWAQKGSSVADIPVYLLKGPEIRVVVDFKTELIPAPLPPDFYSYYFRVEAFDENGTIAAGNITAVPQATWGTYSQYPWPGALNPAQPNGVQTWVFQLHGFGPFTTPVNAPNWGRAYKAGVLDLPTLAIYNGANYWQYDGYNDKGPKTIFCSGRGAYGDHVNYGIMWGKTYTIVVTEENQIGYIQLATVTATPTCSGITTVVFEMDRMARIDGFVYTRNFMGDFRAGSWVSTTAQGATASVKAWGPMDGFFYTYVKPDTYTLTADGLGYKSASRTVIATWGGVAGGQDFYLEESGIPIPEFPAVGILALVSALAASLYLLRWKRPEAILVR